jgi:hypothetical protein
MNWKIAFLNLNWKPIGFKDGICDRDEEGKKDCVQFMYVRFY